MSQTYLGRPLALAATSSTGISENFHGNEFKFVTRGFLGLLITNITYKNVSDVPGASGRPCSDVVYRNFREFSWEWVQNCYSGVFRGAWSWIWSFEIHQVSKNVDVRWLHMIEIMDYLWLLKNYVMKLVILRLLVDIKL